jgi:hypothetical protein
MIVPLGKLNSFVPLSWLKLYWIQATFVLSTTSALPFPRFEALKFVKVTGRLPQSVVQFVTSKKEKESKFSGGSVGAGITAWAAVPRKSSIVETVRQT